MKKAFSIIVAALLLLAGAPADARNVKYILTIAGAMEAKDVTEKPEGAVKFFFGRDHAPTVMKKFRSDVADRRSGNSGKSDEKACNEAFLSALLALEKRAQKLGANAVVNIVSYYKKVEMSSSSEFECHGGLMRVVVILKGDSVTIADK